MLSIRMLCFVLCSTTIAKAANILVFMPLPIKSHFRGFQPLFEELSRRGHNVTVVSSFPLGRSVANYTDIGPFISKERVRNVMELVDMNFFTSVPLKWRLGVEMSEKIMSHETMKEFIHSKSLSFDLVMIEAFCQEYTVAIGHKFNAPVINLAPAMIWVSISKWLHVPSTFSYIPDYCTRSSNDMSFADRLKNTVNGVMQSYVEHFLYLPKVKAIMNKHFTYEGWQSRPPLEQMLNNVSLTLMNAHHAVGVTRPYLPGVIEVGGMHIKAPKPLPQNLQTFLDSAEDGVIFISFGTLVNLNDLPEERMTVFLNVIKKLKQNVILKWTPKDKLKLPQHIMLGSWFPQTDILAHKNTRLFITHGRLHSIEEATHFAKPIVGVPFFADQFTNMKLVEKKGYGKLIYFFEMTEESFGNAIEEILSNPKFEENAMAHSEVYKDQPTTPLDRAVYWVEYVIRNGGAGHLKSDSIELNDVQYFLIDVSIAVIVLTGLFSWLCYFILVRITHKTLIIS